MKGKGNKDKPQSQQTYEPINFCFYCQRQIGFAKHDFHVLKDSENSTIKYACATFYGISGSRIPLSFRDIGMCKVYQDMTPEQFDTIMIERSKKKEAVQQTLAVTVGLAAGLI